MTVIAFKAFRGEVPRLPPTMLPDLSGQYVLNVDLQHGDLKGVRDLATLAAALSIGGKVPKTLYTEDGVSYFAWAYDADVTKSQVTAEIYSRIYYTILYDDSPLIKVARTQRNADGVFTPVIGSALVGGNFQPPENSTPGAGFGNLGPDSWVLGVPTPRVQADSVDDNLVLTLVDKSAWPGIPRLQLRVTFFWEAPNGQQVATQDISNTELATDHPPDTPQNVFWTNNSGLRGNKVQDMLWPLGYQQRPYKYYFFLPPAASDFALSRTVDVLNTDASLNIVITFGQTTPVPTPVPGGSEGAFDGNEA